MVHIETGKITFSGEPIELEPGYYELTLPQTAVFSNISLAASESESWVVNALTLVNSQKDTFQSVTLGNYRLIHSGDVKIYENLDVQPRAFLVQNWQRQSGVAAALAAMQRAIFDPRETAVLLPMGELPDLQPGVGTGETAVEILTYEPGRIEIRAQPDSPAFLLLTEAYYPGWRARIDGQPADIYQADIYFQGVFLDPGDHEILFEYHPESFGYGRVLSLVGIFILLILITALAFGRRTGNARNFT